MPSLYKSYCYPDLQAVADSIKSTVTFGDGTVVSDAVVVGTSIDVSLYFVNKGYVYTINPPVCTKLGFDNSYTGISTNDAVFYGSSVSLVLILAWGIKIIRRTL